MSDEILEIRDVRWKMYDEGRNTEKRSKDKVNIATRRLLLFFSEHPSDELCYADFYELNIGLRHSAGDKPQHYFFNPITQ